MLVIRLQRRGKKNQPFFKIVVTDKRNSPKAGVSVEEIGHINPLTKERAVNKERASYWLSVGAKPSPRVFNALVDEGVIIEKKKKIRISPVRNPEKKAAQKKVKEVEKPKEEPVKEAPKEETETVSE